MSDGGQRKPSFREFGPAWITAISALIVALTGAGFFAGRASAPQGTAPPAQTVTKTVVSTVPARDDPASEAAGSDDGTYFAGNLTWGEFNLDQREPKRVGSKYITSHGTVLYAYDDSAELAVWETDSVPSKDECANVVATDGSNQTAALVAGNRVCGQTAEGRVFRIEILGVGGSGIRSKTTVWHK